MDVCTNGESEFEVGCKISNEKLRTVDIKNTNLEDQIEDFLIKCQNIYESDTGSTNKIESSVSRFPMLILPVLLSNLMSNQEL